MPVIEIASWVPSKAYLADPTILKPALDFLKTVDGCKDVYTGVAEEQSTLFLFVVWESFAHHKALINNPEYPQVIGLGPSIASKEEGGSGVTVYHVEFINPFEPSQSAPTTEILAITLKEGKTKEDLTNVVNTMSAKINAENPKHAPVTWGQTLEDEQKFYLTIGWDSSDAHRQIIGDASFLPILTDLRATAVLKMVHVSFKKPSLQGRTCTRCK
ncbi:hypothetical protein CPB84DRAFT_1733897 [Gymnopilus junonius]|uniref:ABM domain-containing protein n=1 Tax=Gymnopilus junonius TaxID=109634 RepID=A0A9P5NHS1_GYMJU|nr:hypothetical protein CPB84DRAFT_1733897 [Gymnopilus junonius]